MLSTSQYVWLVLIVVFTFIAFAGTVLPSPTPLRSLKAASCLALNITGKPSWLAGRRPLATPRSNARPPAHLDFPRTPCSGHRG